PVAIYDSRDSPSYLAMCFSFPACHSDHRELHSFPTRRSSDLTFVRWQPLSIRAGKCMPEPSMRQRLWGSKSRSVSRSLMRWCGRSEEHTSELQSRENLVCRLLLEKKNIFLASSLVLKDLVFRA